MVKIAICFAGLPRFIPESIASWNNFIRKYNADVFVHTWINNDFMRYETCKKITEAVSPKLIIADIPKHFNTAIYQNRIWAYRSEPANVLSMWYSINQSINASFLNYSNYDIICRARLDWWCQNLELIETEFKITVPNDPGLSSHHFKYNNIPYVAHNDQFAYGSPILMKKYANTFNKIPMLYTKHGVDFCSELFLTANLISEKVEVQYQQDLNYRILK